MNRRDWMRTWSGVALAGAATAIPSEAGTTVIKCEPFRLNLRHTWTTTMSSSAFRDVIYLQLTNGGITGYGEGAPIVRYHESAESGTKAIEQLGGLLQAADPAQYTKVLQQVFAKLEGNWAAKSAIDIALMDWNGKKLGVPLYRLLGLDAADAPVTTFSIGIDTPEMTRQKVEEAASYPVLKIKVGLDKDEQTIEAVRSVTSKPLRVDANEGFKSKEEALRRLTGWQRKASSSSSSHCRPTSLTSSAGCAAKPTCRSSPMRRASIPTTSPGWPTPTTASS